MKIDFEFLIFDSTLLSFLALRDACPPSLGPKTEPQVKNMRIYNSRSKKNLYKFPPTGSALHLFHLFLDMNQDYGWSSSQFSVFLQEMLLVSSPYHWPVHFDFCVLFVNHHLRIEATQTYLLVPNENPNRIGLKYDFSRLQILKDGLVIGLIRTPEFYQPARSHNVSVEMNLVFQCLDITTIMSGVDTANFSIKVLGDIGVRLRVLQIKLPKMKAHFDANSQALWKKCSIGFYL
ncbi:uncharacterized protein LOC112508773 isoform X2 [Cynara cardunculus var. scolymus]|uniref:uncharacterized protein LOC112508773 isoform X2 n=1 Tax=Cynara cardunculus var. scolymus TaxID=59895 RepID=UPI000D62F87F|nr:uncharacterized protein LOC112508773 isoform X2 [Cynara cardunculus var. scolymus]